MPKMDLIIKLHGDVNYHLSSCAGIYNIAPNLVNEKSYWLQEEGEFALYNHDGFWLIGNKLGQPNCMIHSQGDFAEWPQEVTEWNYLRKNKRNPTSDINIQPGT